MSGMQHRDARSIAIVDEVTGEIETTCTVGEFFAANDETLDADDREECEATLDAGRGWFLGGGAQPLVRIVAVESVLSSYDYIIVAFSGGKDSLACVLHLLELGVPRERIELWHHDVDGREGSTLMDWPCTRDYCRKVAEALGVRLFFSWKVGGFEREMLRDASATAPIAFETPDGVKYTGGKGKPNTRLQFPQVAADLSVRWCSAYLKIDVGAAAIRNQERFNGSRTLFVTGERAEESASRARYESFEPHRSDSRTGRKARHVDQWRPVHSWSERDVWDIIKRWRVNPHPAYRLGWGRVSCAACIFGSPDQWASEAVRRQRAMMPGWASLYDALRELSLQKATED